MLHEVPTSSYTTSADLTSSASDQSTAQPVGDPWWIFDRQDWTLADATAPEAMGRGGHQWTLEYTSGQHTLQVVAFDRESPGVALTEKLPRVGTAMVDEFPATLRQFEGNDKFPPSVGAAWVDGDLHIQFGGPSLQEAELRDLLKDVKRVDRAQWNIEAGRGRSLDQHPVPSSTRP